MGEPYFGGGHGGLWDQVLVDAGACDGSFAAVGGQGAGGGEARGEGCAGVLLGNLLDHQHFGHHLFATGRVFWKQRGDQMFREQQWAVGGYNCRLDSEPSPL